MDRCKSLKAIGKASLYIGIVAGCLILRRLVPSETLDLVLDLATMATISFQVIKTSLVNPADAIRYE